MSIYIGSCSDILPLNKWRDPLLTIKIYQIVNTQDNIFKFKDIKLENMIHRYDLKPINMYYLNGSIYRVDYGYMTDEKPEPKIIIKTRNLDGIILKSMLINIITDLPEPICYDYLRDME